MNRRGALPRRTRPVKRVSAADDVWFTYGREGDPGLARAVHDRRKILCTPMHRIFRRSRAGRQEAARARATRPARRSGCCRPRPTSPISASRRRTASASTWAIRVLPSPSGRAGAAGSRSRQDAGQRCAAATAPGGLPPGKARDVAAQRPHQASGPAGLFWPQFHGLDAVPSSRGLRAHRAGQASEVQALTSRTSAADQRTIRRTKSRGQSPLKVLAQADVIREGGAWLGSPGPGLYHCTWRARIAGYGDHQPPFDAAGAAGPGRACLHRHSTMGTGTVGRRRPTGAWPDLVPQGQVLGQREQIMRRAGR